MAKFLTPFRAEKLDDGDLWEVYEPLEYSRDTETIIVPKGFKTDLASIPKPFRNIFDNDGCYTRAAVVHDWCYNQRKIAGRTRAQADGILLEAMDVLNVPWYQRWPIYWAVRAGGWVFWNKK